MADQKQKIKYNKTEEVLLYLLKNNPRSSITSLMKMSYLADLIAVKKQKRQITNFAYRRHYFGPFDKKIYSCIEGLIEDKIISAESDYGLTGEEFSVYKINPKKEDSIKFDDLKKEEIKILDELVANVRGYGAKMLTELAYKTKPMKKLGAKIGGSEHLGELLKLDS